MTNEMTDLLPCPCCESKTIQEPGCYEICPNCGWEDDPVQSKNSNFSGGANKLSLFEARKLFAQKIQSNG